MPELSFVLPHWVYWSGLVLFPLITLLLYRRRKPRSAAAPVSLPLAYFIWLVGGFIGIHRLFLKSNWALVFVLLFVSILFVNVELREARNVMSASNNEISVAQYKVERAEKAVSKGKENAQQQLEQAQQRLVQARTELLHSSEQQLKWQRISKGLGGTVVILLLIDLLLLPKLVRARNSAETNHQAPAFVCPNVEAEHDDTREPFVFNRAVSSINGVVGEFVAYWSLLAVGVYYYEVMARYVFNSPTNWAHESMFLMFGMQYLLAGGFVLREGAHVRVDVLYLRLSKRGKSIVDLFTSVFFFIFVVALLTSGWTFFMDSYKAAEVSFTEWGISYWPIKFALPLGALLLLLQGVALLLKDIAIVINPDIAELDAQTRPEG